MAIKLAAVSTVPAPVHVAPIPARAARFTRALEQSPGLLERLQECSDAELGLRDEAALARTLLDEILESFAVAHRAENGNVPAAVFAALIGQLKTVQSIVRDAAEIESKRDDQKLSARHVLMLVASLRDKLRAQLMSAFGERAASTVDDVFAEARWTGGVDDDTLAEALAAPAAYTVSFRKLERDGAGTVREGAAVQHVALPNPGAPQSWDPAPPVIPCNTEPPVAAASGAGDAVGPSPAAPPAAVLPRQDASGRATIPASASDGEDGDGTPPALNEDEIATSKPLDALTVRAKSLRAQLDRMNAERERERTARGAKLNP